MLGILVLTLMAFFHSSSSLDLSSCCVRLNIVSVGEASEHQSNRLGSYRFNGLYSDRPVYENEERKEFLFYLTSRNRGLWMVGPEVGEFNGGLANRGDEACAEDTPISQWKFTDGISWNLDTNLTITCLDQEEPACEYNDQTIFEGGDLPAPLGGGGLVTDSVTSLECIRECEKREACKYWTWTGEEGSNCFLKTDNFKKVRKPKHVSGSIPTRCRTNTLLEEESKSSVEEPGFDDQEINGKFKITSLKWDEKLSDTNSKEFEKLANSIEASITDMLINEKDLAEQADFTVKVQKFKQGSVVCDFKVNYILKEAYVAIPFAIKPSNITDAMGKNFQFKKGILFQRFLIAANSFNASAPVDHCSAKGCSHKCNYDYDVEDYLCTCPKNLVLDSAKLNCISEEEAAEEITEEATEAATEKTAVEGSTEQTATEDSVVSESTTEDEKATEDKTEITTGDGEGADDVATTTKASSEEEGTDDVATTTKATSDLPTIAVESEDVTTSRPAFGDKKTTVASILPDDIDEEEGDGVTEGSPVTEEGTTESDDTKVAGEDDTVEPVTKNIPDAEETTTPIVIVVAETEESEETEETDETEETGETEETEETGETDETEDQEGIADVEDDEDSEDVEDESEETEDQDEIDEDEDHDDSKDGEDATNVENVDKDVEDLEGTVETETTTPIVIIVKDIEDAAATGDETEDTGDKEVEDNVIDLGEDAETKTTEETVTENTDDKSDTQVTDDAENTEETDATSETETTTIGDTILIATDGEIPALEDPSEESITEIIPDTTISIEEVTDQDVEDLEVLNQSAEVTTEQVQIDEEANDDASIEDEAVEEEDAEVGDDTATTTVTPPLEKRPRIDVSNEIPSPDEQSKELIDDEIENTATTVSSTSVQPNLEDGSKPNEEEGPTTILKKDEEVTTLAINDILEEVSETPIITSENPIDISDETVTTTVSPTTVTVLSVVESEDGFTILTTTVKPEVVTTANLNIDEITTVLQPEIITEVKSQPDTEVSENVTTLKPDSEITTLSSDSKESDSEVTTVKSDLDVTTLTPDSEITTLESDSKESDSEITTKKSDVTTLKSDVTTLLSDTTTSQEDSISTSSATVSEDSGTSTSSDATTVPQGLESRTLLPDSDITETSSEVVVTILPQESKTTTTSEDKEKSTKSPSSETTTISQEAVVTLLPELTTISEETVTTTKNELTTASKEITTVSQSGEITTVSQQSEITTQQSKIVSQETVRPEDAVVTLLTTIRSIEDITEEPLGENEVETAEDESEDGMHEFDCTEMSEATFSSPNQIPLECRLRSIGETKTVFILINKEGLDTSRLFDKNVKVVVKDLMVMDISPKRK